MGRHVWIVKPNMASSNVVNSWDVDGSIGWLKTCLNCFDNLTDDHLCYGRLNDCTTLAKKK